MSKPSSNKRECSLPSTPCLEDQSSRIINYGRRYFILISIFWFFYCFYSDSEALYLIPQEIEGISVLLNDLPIIIEASNIVSAL
jgi:hypothetical protein